MKSFRILILFILIIALFAGGMFWLTKNGSKVFTPKTPNQAENSSKFSEAQKVKTSFDYLKGEIPPKPLVNQVFYEDSGFNPATISASKNAIITFFNVGPKNLFTLAGPLLKESVTVGLNKNQSIQFTDSGTFVYENLADKSKVTVIIK